jgi:hypothetical protein
MYRLLLFIATVGAAFAQTQSSIIQGQWPPETLLVFRDGSNNQQYTCAALAKQPNYTWSTTAQITNIVDSGTTATITFAAAHGLSADNRIVIAGMTSAGTTALNASFKIAVTNTTVITVTTSGVTDGTYTPVTDPALVISTTAPRTTAAIWQIQRLYYTTTYLDRSSYAEGDSDPNKICDNRTAYAFN